MNVNAAVQTDVMMTQSTAPPKDSGRSASESTGRNFQQVMEQYTGTKEKSVPKTKVTDSGAAAVNRNDSRPAGQKETLSASQNAGKEKLQEQTSTEEEKKAEDARLQAMLALAEPVVVQVVSPEFLLEAIGDDSVTGQNQTVETVDASLNGQPAIQEAVSEPVNQNPVENAFDQEMMAVTDGQNLDPKAENPISRNPVTDIAGGMPETSKAANSETANQTLAAQQPDSQNKTVKPSIHENAETVVQKPVAETQSQNGIDQQNLQASGKTTVSETMSALENASVPETTQRPAVSEAANQAADQQVDPAAGETVSVETSTQTVEATVQNPVNSLSAQDKTEGPAVEQSAVPGDTVKSQIHGKETEGKALDQIPVQTADQDTKTEAVVSGTKIHPASQNTESKLSHEEPILKNSGENRQTNPNSMVEQSNLKTAVQSEEALQQAQQLLSESTQETAAGQAPVVSDAVSNQWNAGSGQNKQTTVNTVQPEAAEKSAIQEPVISKASGQSSTAGDTESGFADMLKNQSSLTGTTKTSAEDEAAPVKEPVSTLSEAQASLEELKRNAEAKGVNLMDRLAEARLTGGVKAEAVNQPADQNGASVVSQVKEGLEQGVKNQLREFTIHLKPEGLGDVIIKMVSQDGKLTVNIGTSNAETQKLINNQMMSLKEMLEPLHAEVGEVYHSSQDAMEFLSYGQNMSENQRQQTSHYHGNLNYGGYTEEEEVLTEAEYITAQSRMARLYTYV